MNTFGERLAHLRSKEGLSQADLAKHLKIAKSTLGMYETDRREPGFEMTRKIADHFGVTIDYLTGGKDGTQQKEPQLDKDKKYALELFDKITDPDKKKAALEVLRGLADRKE